MPGLLHNHIAAVTGAGSGIGRAIALGFAREGASVAALDVNGDTATQTVASICAAGGTSEAFALDIADRAACDVAAATVASRTGPISILVNNAGSIGARQFTGDPLLRWSRTGPTSWRSISTACSTSSMPFWRRYAQTKGRFVNIASVQSFAHMRTPISAAYTTAKTGARLYPGLAAELGKDGVRVNAVGPGD